MEHDREAALSAARNIHNPRGSSGSRNQSRESSRGREESREARKSAAQPTPTTVVPKELSEEQMERKTKSTMDEYLHLHDLKEAITCVKELESPGSLHLFVYHALNHVLEKTKQGRQMTGSLLHNLVKTGIITVDQYLRG